MYYLHEYEDDHIDARLGMRWRLWVKDKVRIVVTRPHKAIRLYGYKVRIGG